MGIHKPEVKWSRHHVGRPQAQGYTWNQQVPASYRELTHELTHFSSGKEEKPELEKRIKGKKSSSLYYGQEDSITGDSNQTNSFTAKPPQPTTTNMCDRRNNTSYNATFADNICLSSPGGSGGLPGQHVPGGLLQHHGGLDSSMCGSCHRKQSLQRLIPSPASSTLLT